jgi:hypothetical protein
MTNDGGANSAAEAARAFLLLYSPDKPARFSAPGEAIRNPALLIQQALDEAQFTLNQASSVAFKARTGTITKFRKRQKVVSGLHFVTASGFGLLLAGQWPEVTKWIGAVVSLGAGMLGLTVPSTLASSERQVLVDIDEVSELSGRIVKTQAEIRFNSGKISPAISKESLSIIKQASTLAKRYQLDQVAAAAGALPRPARTHKSSDQGN